MIIKKKSIDNSPKPTYIELSKSFAAVGGVKGGKKVKRSILSATKGNKVERAVKSQIGGKSIKGAVNNIKSGISSLGSPIQSSAKPSYHLARVTM
jgi:hypothetical protein